MQAVGMSTSFNAQGAVDTTKNSEYVPFKVKYDLGNDFSWNSKFSHLHLQVHAASNLNLYECRKESTVPWVGNQEIPD